jgi:acyl-lipid (7-3)-desaturase (Delta-4 desaturase)
MAARTRLGVAMPAPRKSPSRRRASTASAPVDVPAATPMTTTLDPSRKYTRIRGVVYDVTDFEQKHPGGAQLLSLCVGRDATILIESHHLRPEIVQKYLKTLPRVEGQNEAFGPEEAFPKPLDSALYRKIQARVREEIVEPLKASHGRTPSGRGGCVFDAAVVVAFFIGALARFWYKPDALSGCVLGLAGYWSGTGLQHTANHGGLTKSGFWNQFWGWLGNDVFIGKSSIEWRYHHMVSHHSYCNDAELDQDVYTALPLLRLDPSQELKWFHRYQAFYAPLMWPFLWLAAQTGDFQNIVVDKASPGVSYIGLKQSELALYWIGKALHFGLLLGVPAYLHGFSTAIGPFLMYGAFGSFVLCWFFIVSHNLDALTPANLSAKTKQDWGAWQIETSASWGNAFWSFFSGGLNLQIEHHLFPGCAHNLYPKMVPIIKDECAKAGVTYTAFEGYTGLLPITMTMFKYLHNMGRPTSSPKRTARRAASKKTSRKSTAVK